MYFSDSISSAGPSSVDEPDLSVMLFEFFVEKVGIDLRFEGHEGLSETGREGRSGLFDSLFGSGNFGSVS
jgi:hypothetical protein